ncbi:MAG TPA: hypothetical protein VMH85_14480 [Terriglobales bacterium]|nr:hypothetical protein [Terriglobales bacterium]
MPDGTREVPLPAELCRAAEQRFAAHYGSLEQFLTFVLQELLRDDAYRMDEAEQAVVEEKLRDLGYI